MRAKQHPNGATQLWLSARDTYDWAHRPRASWPCSTLSDKALYVEFEPNGDLVDIRVNGRYLGGNEDIDGHELSAITSDFLRERFGPEHPAIRN